MNPTWTSDCGRIQLYHGDCRDIIPHVKADAVITDPPYGINYRQSAGNSKTKKWVKRHVNKPILNDNKPFDPALLVGLSVPCVLWGANNYASRLPDSRAWLIWDKKPDLGSNDLGDGETAWTNGGGVLRIFRHRWSGVIRDSQNGEIVNHPTEKPVALMKWCMDVAKVPPDAVVFDPYMGSGTTGIACIRTGRRFIGVELDPHYFEIAKQRIIRELAQPMIPGMEPEKHTQGALI